MKRRRLLVSLTLPLILLLGLPGDARAKKKEKKRVLISGEVVVRFVPERELILVWTDSGRVLLLSRPGLEVVGQLTVDGREKVAAMRLSDDQRWLGMRIKRGPVRVWNMVSGEPVLTLTEQVSQGFAFDSREDRLILFQPKIGVTQWDLATGERVGPTLSEVITVFLGNIWVSPNGNYVWTSGRCRVPAGYFDYCLFDLRDGAVVAWADDLSPYGQLGREVSEKDHALQKEFFELVRAVGFYRHPSGGGVEAPDKCDRRPDGKLFCCSSQSVALTDDSLPPADSETGSGRASQVMKLFGVPTARELRTEFPGRYLWQIRASQERKRLFIDSCDLSEDGKWVLLGVNGLEVDLFSTEELEPQSLTMYGSWQQPVLVSSTEFP